MLPEQDVQAIERFKDINLDKNLTRNWYLTVLSVIPIICVLGNLLVIAAVWTTKSLQTPTNYLLVSLACADILIGLCVLPFNIYLSINALHWHLSAELCYMYCLLDVAASTCSIVHLVLISVDRLVAATKPAEYKTPKHKKRVYMAIGTTWLFSIFISLPVVTGFNTKTRYFLLKKHYCGIYSPMYMLCSSLFAFYLPCIIMTITYGYIFQTLRKRLRSIQLQEMAGGQFLGFGADVGNITTSAVETVIGVEAKNRYMISWEKPLLQKIKKTAAEHDSSLNDSEREQLETILEAVQPSCSSIKSSQLKLTNFCVETDEISVRPPSVVLEAVTIRPSVNNNFEFFSSSLEVPKSFPKILLTRRFSEAIQSTLQKHTQVSTLTYIDSDLPTENKWENNNNFDYHKNSCLHLTTDIVKKISDDKKSEIFQRKTTKKASNRRHSYQPFCFVPVDDSGNTNKTNGSTLKPNLRGKSMRRLSKIITEWERPSRASLSQMYSYARRESVYIARKKLAGLKDWALELIAKLKSKQGMAIRRETRATKLVATVMGVFLICWMPFFTLNMVKVYRLMAGNWPSNLEFMFHWTSALGYLNSSLNFVIYSAINKRFRSSFRRLIGLSKRRCNQNKSGVPCNASTFNRNARIRVSAAGKTTILKQANERRYSCHKNQHNLQKIKKKSSVMSRAPLPFKLIDEVNQSSRISTTLVGSALDNWCGAAPFIDNCGCATFANKSSRLSKFRKSSKGNPLIILRRRFSIQKPEIKIDEMSIVSKNYNSISAGGITTYQRLSSEFIEREVNFQTISIMKAGAVPV